MIKSQVQVLEPTVMWPGKSLSKTCISCHLNSQIVLVAFCSLLEGVVSDITWFNRTRYKNLHTSQTVLPSSGVSSPKLWNDFIACPSSSSGCREAAWLAGSLAVCTDTVKSLLMLVMQPSTLDLLQRSCSTLLEKGVICHDCWLIPGTDIKRHHGIHCLLFRDHCLHKHWSQWG